MPSPLSSLNVSLPVLAAPMAGGPTTPELVLAAAQVGSLGFLAAGYKTPDALAAQIKAVRDGTDAFGVNVFVPNRVGVDREQFGRYAARLQEVAEPYGLQLAGSEPVEDDDGWGEKIDVLLSDPVPLVSFTFGVPDASLIRSFQKVGTLTVQTVTSPEEARLAVDAGVDVLAVQASAAGGHSGTLTPSRIPASIPLPDLLAAVRQVTALPLIATGGVGGAAEVAEAMDAGASAVAVGTILLRSDESGASEVHKAAIADATRGSTVITRAFTGRPARALPNEFIARYDAEAPLGYPAIHHLTSGLRKASAAAGNPELVNLWAGTGYQHATAEPAGDILTRLASKL